MKNTKIVALVAAVALLVLGTAFASFAASPYNWYQDGVDWRCADKNGDDLYDAWAKSGNGWYYLNDEGYMAREYLVEGEKGKQYVGADGALVSDQWVRFVDDENTEYYMYFQSNSRAAVGSTDTIKPVTVGNHKYIFNPEGRMMTGWVGEGYDQNDDSWQSATYYCGDLEDGAVKTGWQYITVDTTNVEGADFNETDYWFWLGTNGKKVTATTIDGDNPKYGQKKLINGKYYAFDEFGRMTCEWVPVWATSESEIKSYACFHTVEDGSRYADGWFKVVPTENVYTGDAKKDYDDETEKWFYAKKGKLVINNIIKWNGKNYGLNEKGEMVTGLQKVEPLGNEDGFKFVEATLKDVKEGSGFANIYYFSAEDTDGSRKSGAQTVTLDDDPYNFYFATKAATFDAESELEYDKFQAVTGFVGNKYYYNGLRVDVDGDTADYAVFEAIPGCEGADGAKKPNAVGLTPMYFKEAAGEEVTEKGEGVLPANKYAVVSKAGVISSSVNSVRKDGNYKATLLKDGNAYYWVIERNID